MRVLHYTLGWPPQRTGGLTNYAVDLMPGFKIEMQHLKD